MKMNRLAALLTVLAYVLSMAALPHLPEQVAIHWNASGEADGFAGKWFGAFLPPVIMTFVLALVSVVPKLDPKKANYESFQKSYGIFTAALALFLFALHIVTLAHNLGVPVDVGLVVPVGVGALFIVLGNYMPKIKHNYFVGIRTPWTLESETVWHKTHRFGGKVFVAMGVLSMLTAFWDGDWRFALFMIVLVLGNVYLIVQSFLYYKQEQRERS